jgi:hypothetical protein
MRIYLSSPLPTTTKTTGDTNSPANMMVSTACRRDDTGITPLSLNGKQLAVLDSDGSC